MQATGIQIDGPLFRWATLKRTSKGVTRLAWGTESCLVKPLYIPSDYLISGLSSHALLIRSLPFPTGNPSRALQQALVLQAETSLHLDPEELRTVAVLDKKRNRATTYTTTKSALSAHLAQLADFQLDPERASAVPAALFSFIRWKAPEMKSYFLIDIGMSLSNCLWVEEGSIRQAHAIELGIGSLRQAASEDRKRTLSLKEREDIDFASTKTGQSPTLAEGVRTIRRELSKILHSFQCCRPLIFTGETESTDLFREFLLDTLRECVTEEAKIGLTLEEQRYAICMGLSIDYLLNRKYPLQFREQATLAPRSWQTLGRFSMGLIALSFLLSTSVYWIGSWLMNQREQEIVHNLETWISLKDPSLKTELFSMGSDPAHLVEKWLYLIEKNTKEYPLISKAPPVAQVLHWLARHPLLGSIQVEQFRYQLLSFPRLHALSDPYSTKIELDFTATNPMHARQFHEALLEGDALIDPTQEIGWEVFPDRYRTSFYLKNETHVSF